jgi:hypothetical protein
LKNHKSAGLECDNSIAGGGGGGARTGAWGFGQSNYNSSKSDSCGCSLNPDEAFDEAALFAALKVDVERTLRDNGAKIVDSGSTGQANFYFAYTLKNVNGRVALSGTRSGNHFYNVIANLTESGN